MACRNAYCLMIHCFKSFVLQLRASIDVECRIIEQQIRNLSCVVKTRRIRSIPSASATLRRLYNYTIIFSPEAANFDSAAARERLLRPDVQH